MAHEVCSIDLVNLETTLQHHAALRAWVTAAHETHRIEEERCKWNLTKTKARILKQAREVKDEFTGKLKTTAVLEAERDDHPEVAAAVEALYNNNRYAVHCEPWWKPLGIGRICLCSCPHDNAKRWTTELLTNIKTGRNHKDGN